MQSVSAACVKRSEDGVCERHVGPLLSALLLGERMLRTLRETLRREVMLILPRELSTCSWSEVSGNGSRMEHVVLSLW